MAVRQIYRGDIIAYQWAGSRLTEPLVQFELNQYLSPSSTIALLLCVISTGQFSHSCFSSIDLPINYRETHWLTCLSFVTCDWKVTNYDFVIPHRNIQSLILLEFRFKNDWAFQKWCLNFELSCTYSLNLIIMMWNLWNLCQCEHWNKRTEYGSPCTRTRGTFEIEAYFKG